MLGGIQYAAGLRPGEDGATIDSNFQIKILDTNLIEPMELAVAPDGRVFYIERAGKIKIYNPQTTSPITAGQISVFNKNEDGLLGLALDPDFNKNHWIYLMYSPAGSTPKQHVSRFTVAGDTVEMASEKVLLQIPTQRDQCCHSGGSLAFGPGGNLFISAGDNTSPFECDGFAPLDERPNRSAWDSQRTAGNANDLRGKILRIHPEADGTYSIPNGNLFSKTNSLTKPEIYVMGCRNPFRISVDPENGWLYWGDIGPDADADNPRRGPRGHDEINQARSAGNYGWPYFLGNNKPYVKYDFGTSVTGQPFNPDKPENNSPNNTGPHSLPPARGAWIWYPYGPSREFPEMGDTHNRTAMAGPIYHYNSNLVSAVKLPAYYDKTFFAYDPWRSSMVEVKLDDDGQVLKINPFLAAKPPHSPLDLELGPDGALYWLDWKPPVLALFKAEYVPGNNSPADRVEVVVDNAATNAVKEIGRAHV